MTQIDIFTDGSAWNNGKSNCKAGYGIYIPKKNIRISEKFTNSPTNQRAELFAILRSLQITEENNIKIYTDSMYSIKCLTVWCDNWKKNNWKNSKGEDVKNQELVKEILRLMCNKSVTFQHVNSHQNKPDTPDKIYEWDGNRIADKLASSAIELKVLSLV